ncbi:hypothetical protein MASR2M78_03350 [Treponema sp.]
MKMAEKQADPKKTEDKKKVFLIVGGALLILALLGTGIFFATSSSKPSRARQNTLILAKDYVERGEFQRALDLLDKLLIEDASDEEARALRDMAIDAARLSANEKDAAAAEAVKSGQDSVSSAISQIGKAVESAAKVASQSPQANAERERAEDARRKALEEARAKSEAEAAARAAEDASRKAAAEAENQRRKAQDEELARKSKELQNQVRIVNDLVTQGRKLIREGSYSKADEVFSEAVSRVPSGETRFQAQKQAEIGDAYYEGFARDREGKEGQASLKEAIRYARDAIKTDSGQALPHYTLGKINGDLKQWDNAVTELKESSRLDPNNYLYAYELGRAYFNARKFADARQAFETASSLKMTLSRLGITWVVPSAFLEKGMKPLQPTVRQ